MNPDDLKRVLIDEQIPEHHPGFWDRLDGRLAVKPSAARTRSGWWVAMQAAAAVLVVAGVAATLVRNVAGINLDPGDGIAVVPVVTSTSVPQDSLPETAPVDPAPWDAESLSSSDVPAVLGEQWHSAENQLWCSALYPSDLGGVNDATIRAADFGGGWAVAWDTPDQRSAFGIAGVGLPAWEDIGVRMPAVVAYGDQIVGYGGEGFDDTASKRMAEFSIAGQLCAYQAWSELGDEHLLALVESLRRVEGLESPPIEAPTETEPVDLGAAPWTVPAIEYPLGWPTPPQEILAFIPTSGIPTGASIRTANESTFAITWDRASGPGHDTFNFPCSDCGRGVIGVSMGSASPPTDRDPDYMWSDGSVGYLGPRVGAQGIPLDRVRFVDRSTGELVEGGVRLDIYIPDLSASVSVWSHLGVESLLEVVGSLRLADPGT